MKIQALCILSLLVMPTSIYAAEPVVYPANNQTSEIQTNDQQECRKWAIEHAGYDPALGMTGSIQEPALNEASQKRDRTVLRSAAKGAAVGGLGGSMGGEFGEGAAAGAAVGVVSGLAKKKKQEQAGQQTASGTGKNPELEDKYYRAYSLCLEARGYMVK